MSRGAPPRWGERPPAHLEERIVIQGDGIVLARSGKVEYGQGIRTGFRRIVAHELHLPEERVRVELGETDVVPWDMGTFGSMSTASDGATLRRAAAYALALLRERAAAKLGCAAQDLEPRDGRLVAPDGRGLGYGELAALAPLAGLIPEAGELSFADGPDCEGGVDRVEARSLVTGEARYPHDVRLPGMLRGHVLAPPRRGAHLAALDDAAARAVPGVVEVVRDGDFVGVLAERREQALQATACLGATWTEPELDLEAPIELQMRLDEDASEALAGGALRLEAHYRVPHVAHASILPSAAAADVRERSADIYCATQRPFGLRGTVAGMLGLDPQDVHVHPQHMSGMYGGGGWDQAALDAVRLSRAAGRPVLVEWTRGEEFQRTAQRPVLDADLAAAVDADGRIVAYRARVRTNPHVYGGAAMPPEAAGATSGRNAIPPYDLGRVDVHLRVEQSTVPTSAFRSLAAAPNVFASESFLDELALAAGVDPLDFRLRHVRDPRLRAVIEAVAEMADWPHRPGGDGHGFGLAATIYHGTYVAEVAEVRVAASGRISLGRVFAAVDPGRVVHPDGVRSQIEGGIVQGASWTLFEESRIQGGRVVTRGWRDYRIATFKDAPERIEVRIVGSQENPMTGIGEPGTVVIAAAIGNAVCAATGARIRELPMRPARVQAATSTRI